MSPNEAKQLIFAFIFLLIISRRDGSLKNQKELTVQNLFIIKLSYFLMIFYDLLFIFKF